MKRLIYILIIIISCAAVISAQEKNFLNKPGRSSQILPAQRIFQEIENAIGDGNVSSLSAYLSSQTYLSLTGGNNGYYSSNQAFYVLENFFNVYQVRSFRFNNLQSGDNNPYATGVYSYELRGRRDTAQVFVSLKLVGRNWKITQITIN